MNDLRQAEAVSFREALWWWLKLGCISFGGPAGQIAIMHRELVERRQWITEARFLHALNFCMLLPGPEAQQLATYIGWLLHGVRGALVAGTLFVLPSLLLLIGLAWAYMLIGPAYASDLLYGIRPAVIAIVIFAARRIGAKVLDRVALWPLPIAAFIALLMSVPFPLVILAAALYGWLIRHRLSDLESESSASVGSAVDSADQYLKASHAQSGILHVLKVISIGFGILVACIGGLHLMFGADHLYVQMATFFSKMALVTFGGAYAVMPYVFQGAVASHGWLSAAQMMDGLALGETTPGPLIIVVAFVGFLGGWNAGGTEPWIGGIVGACLVSFFTFLPSFVFVLAGGPWVEKTRGSLVLMAPMRAVTAAVVGAILSLALFFAGQVFWPQGFAQGIDLVALSLCGLCLIALWRYSVGVLPLIMAAALLGITVQTLA